MAAACTGVSVLLQGARTRWGRACSRPGCAHARAARHMRSLVFVVVLAVGAGEGPRHFPRHDVHLRDVAASATSGDVHRVRLQQQLCHCLSVQAVALDERLCCRLHPRPGSVRHTYIHSSAASRQAQICGYALEQIVDRAPLLQQWHRSEVMHARGGAPSRRPWRRRTTCRLSTLHSPPCLCLHQCTWV